MSERPQALGNAAADRLRAEWQRIRRSWLIGLAGTANGEDRFPLISNDERSFVQRVRLERIR